VIRRALRAYPALLRIGFAEAVAYRAEFVVWVLTTTLPLVMLALWTAVAREGSFGPRGFVRADFVAYYLATFIVRTLAGSWVVWQMNHEIRTGTLSLRLLRPVHPYLAYSAEHLAAVPLRAVLALPVAILMLVSTQAQRLPSGVTAIAMVPAALAGAWLIMFLSMAIIGTLGLFIERSIAVFEVWLGVYAILSGYLVPLELMPRVARVAAWLPFRYMLGFPVELMTGMIHGPAAWRNLAVQWAYVAVLVVLASAIWKAGLKRFEAYGA